MEVNQIFPIVNEVAKQSMGTSAINVIDTSSLVALGQQILSSQEHVEKFTNTLVKRIGRTIVSYRAYTNQLGDLVVDDFTFGAIVQKLKVAMPEAVADETFNLEDNKSIDQYIVKKPKVNQKFFVKETPYTFFVTIQYVQLESAFTSAESMGSFISAVYGEMENKMELTIENLGRLAIANFIANTTAPRVFNLVTMYNERTNPTVPLTAETAMFDADFLRFAIGQIKLHSRKMRSMSTIYNEDGAERHTPLEEQRYYVLSDFQTQMETVVQYSAFHTEYVDKVNGKDVPYWQSVESPSSIDVNIESGEGTKRVQLNNIIAVIFDRDALGTYRKERDVLNSPMNARGRYFNVFYHERQLWFNDMSENGIVFTLN